MATPKRRHSKSRRNKKRAHQALPLKALSECPNCHQPKPLHRVCPSCGYYKGNQVMEVKEA